MGYIDIGTYLLNRIHQYSTVNCGHAMTSDGYLNVAKMNVNDCCVSFALYLFSQFYTVSITDQTY